jgi:hypothetical protein
MIIAGTLIILALWMAFIWFVDPDGIASRARRLERIHISKQRPSDAGLGSGWMKAGSSPARRRRWET